MLLKKIWAPFLNCKLSKKYINMYFFTVATRSKVVSGFEQELANIILFVLVQSWGRRFYLLYQTLGERHEKLPKQRFTPWTFPNVILLRQKSSMSFHSRCAFHRNFQYLINICIGFREVNNSLPHPNGWSWTKILLRYYGIMYYFYPFER